MNALYIECAPDVVSLTLFDPYCGYGSSNCHRGTVLRDASEPASALPKNGLVTCARSTVEPSAMYSSGS